MPTRLLREGILTSDRVDQLDAQAEVFYRRLMSRVDDHGLFDARPSILRTSLYPLRVDRVREADITRWIAACEKAGLIALYESGGKPYLWMRDTGWERRSKPKYPLPPENICSQPLASVPVVVDVGLVVDADDMARKRAETPCPADWIPADAWESYVEHRKAKRAKLTGRAVELIVKELEAYRGRGVDPRTVLEFAVKNGHTGLFYKPDPKAQQTAFAPAKYRCSRCGDGCGNGLKHKDNIYCQACYAKIKADERGAELIARNLAAATGAA